MKDGKETHPDYRCKIKKTKNSNLKKNIKNNSKSKKEVNNIKKMKKIIK